GGGAALGGAALISLIMAASARGDWQHLVLWKHYSPTGTHEPVFGMDVSFYLLTLPFLHDIDGWFFGLLFLTALMVVLLYVWRGDTVDLRLAPAALGHLSALLGIFALVIAFGTILDRFDLVFAHNRLVYGAGYTDGHVRVGLALAQAIFGLLLARLLIATVFLRQARV